MDPRWLTPAELAAWMRLAAVMELLPGILDTQLRRDAGLTHFDYFTLAMVSEAPDRTLRMTTLAGLTNSTLPRLSHVISRLEQRGLIERFPCPEDKRATNVRLSEQGWATIVAAAPGHVENVRRHVIDALTADQIGQLREITEALLERLDPKGRMTKGLLTPSHQPAE